MLTASALRDLIVEAGGDADGAADLEEFLTTGFDDLGYDSLALLQAEALLRTRYGVVLPEGTTAELACPRDLLAAVNDRLVPG
ncbi:phosphopantetheine-binding protein [Amycolatopsis sp. Hca4]|uniref:phosphopantetheine-binding protein n=1 Tax=unclassified Amycolatopsis TaxID=2618356 RepID=UPI00159043AE|nr:phosphopantetheine-binding protein [Amycolatopsis sp. Hca4]QKV80122.1 actinorhodin polyketide synthase [Amycolatopsis sp. Hca4]